MKTASQRALAKIHIARKELGLDDGTYRAMLLDIVGQDSCRGLPVNDLYRVLHSLKNKGWKPKVKRRKYSPTSAHKKPFTHTPADKIRALWIDMHQQGFVQDGSESSLCKWVERQTRKHNQGHGINAIEWLTPRLEMLLIEELKKWMKRCEAQR